MSTMFTEEHTLDAMYQLSDKYSMEHLLPFLEPFSNSGPEGPPFVRASARGTYGTFWKPKPNFEEWTFVCSRNNFHIQLAQKSSNSMKTFLLLSRTESMCRLTFLHRKYVVIMLFLLEHTNHLHSIVIDMELQLCKFNPYALAFFWGGTVAEG